MRMKALAATGVAAVLLVAAACGGGKLQQPGQSQAGGNGSAGKSGGDLVIARDGEGTTLNSTDTNFENYSIAVFQQMGEELFSVSPDGKHIVPWLATSYTKSSDGTKYTIKLRTDVKFHNGQPMTAKDVKFSIDQDTKTAATGWGFVNSAIKGVQVVDPHTVSVVLKHPWAPILSDLSIFSNAIVPYDYAGKSEDEFYKAPILTGPFKWGKWVRGQYMKVVKNPNYWQKGKPSLNSITWKVVPDANTRKLQLQGNQVDIDEYPDWSSMAELGKTPGISTSAFPSTRLDYLALNTHRKPYEDPHVRRAIAFAIDRKVMVKSVTFGYGQPANSIIPPGTPYYNKNNPAPQLDLAKAKAELAKSTQPHGFSTNLLIKSGDANQATVSQIIQDNLKQIGITVKIDQLDATTNKQYRFASKFDMALSAWTMDIADPDEWTSYALDPSGGSHSADTFYNNPTVTKLNEQAEVVTDPAKRQALYNQIQNVAANDGALVYLYYSPYAYAYRSTVKGFHVNPLLGMRGQDITKG